MSGDPGEAGRIARVGLVGAGVMGSGIAQWLAARGCSVILRDTQPAALERASAVIRGLFEGAVSRGKCTPDEAAAGLRRIAVTTGWSGFEAADLIIEAVIEDAALKRDVLAEVAKVVSPDALIATNTSALPLEELFGPVPSPERTLGLHFFNPVSRMPLVELVVGEKTSAATRDRAAAFLAAIGKQAVVCRSSPGFVVTRVLFFYLNAAVRAWEQGVPTEEIDAGLREFGWPMGPLRLIDEVGIDVTDFIFGELAHYFPERFRRTAACAQLKRAGLAGRKNGAGRGFYRFDGGPERANDDESRRVTTTNSAAFTASRGSSALAAELMRVMTDEARRCVDEGVVASAAEVNLAMRIGAGFPVARGALL